MEVEAKKKAERRATLLQQLLAQGIYTTTISSPTDELDL
jgi:hypothetical protein